MKKTLFYCLLLIIASTQVGAVTLYSQGGTIGTPLDWNTIGTFNTQPDGSGSDQVPTAGDDVDIRSTHVIEISANASCASLVLRNSGRLEVVNSGTVLTIDGDLDLFSGTDPFNPIVIGGGAKILLTGTLAPKIRLDDKTIGVLGANGTLQIGTTSTAANYEISDFGTNGQLELSGILAPVNGSLATNDKLTLKAGSATSFGRVQWCDYDPAAVLSRAIYTGTITGDVTMEKIIEPVVATGQYPPNDGWRQWAFPLNVTAADITGLAIQGQAHTPVEAQNAFFWDASIFSTAPVLNLVGTNPPGVKTPRNLKADADGWATGWTAVDENNLYRSGFTIYSSQDPGLNSLYGYNISNTITITGEVEEKTKIKGGYTAAPASAKDTSAIFLPASQDTGIGTATGNNDIGWVQMYNPWPSVIDTWFLLEVQFAGGAWGNPLAGSRLTTLYNGVHVWDARNQQYLGWTGATVNFGGIVYNTAGGVNSTPTQNQFDILPFQSFWVKNEGPFLGAPAIDIDRRFTKPSIDGPAYLKTTTVTDLIALAVLDADSARDTWGVHYDADFTDNFDLNGDAYKIFSSSDVPSFHSIEGGQNAAIVSRVPKASDTIQLYFYSFKNNKTCYVHFNDDYAGNLNVVLHDKLTGTYHNLSQNNNYSFTHNTNNDPNRFELIVGNGSIGIDEEVLTSNPVDVYPSGDELVIASEDFTGPARITCFDMAGRLLFTKDVELIAGIELRLLAPLAKNQINLIEVVANNQKFQVKVNN